MPSKQDAYPPMCRSLTEDEWKDLESSHMEWTLDEHRHVILHDPVSGRTRTARTLKLAYDLVSA